MFKKHNSVHYEYKYLLKKIGIRKFIIAILGTIGALIVSYNGTQSFFTGKNSPIPTFFQFLKKPRNANIATIAIIILPHFWILINSFLDEADQRKTIVDLWDRNLKKDLNEKLERLHNNLNQLLNSNSGVSNNKNLRVYFVIPYREKLLMWKYKIVLYNPNEFKDNELNLLFELKRGIFGSICQEKNIGNKYKFPHASPANRTVPNNYMEISEENKAFLNSNIISSSAMPLFDDTNMLIGAIIIDTEDNDVYNFLSIANGADEKEIIDWIGSNRAIINIIWQVEVSKK